MAKVKVSFNASGLIPDGTEVRFVVFDSEIKEGPKGPYINWTLKINEGEFEGRNLWQITSLAPQASFGLESFLDALNFEYTKDEAGNVEFDTDDVQGYQGVAVVGVTSYEGRERNQVNKILPFIE